nr:uncharacterized protein CTRU02_03268 [Colletotrichum truncatum]KAF6797237.1 hypothetical protein CTRU02_03268 [Colletotrichum truncatum]
MESSLGADDGKNAIQDGTEVRSFSDEVSMSKMSVNNPHQDKSSPVAATCVPSDLHIHQRRAERRQCTISSEMVIQSFLTSPVEWLRGTDDGKNGTWVTMSREQAKTYLCLTIPRLVSALQAPNMLREYCSTF